MLVSSWRSFCGLTFRQQQAKHLVLENLLRKPLRLNHLLDEWTRADVLAVFRQILDQLIFRQILDQLIFRQISALPHEPGDKCSHHIQRVEALQSSSTSIH